MPVSRLVHPIIVAWQPVGKVERPLRDGASRLLRANEKAWFA